MTPGRRDLSGCEPSAWLRVRPGRGAARRLGFTSRVRWNDRSSRCLAAQTSQELVDSRVGERLELIGLGAAERNPAVERATGNLVRGPRDCLDAMQRAPGHEPADRATEQQHTGQAQQKGVQDLALAERFCATQRGRFLRKLELEKV